MVIKFFDAFKGLKGEFQNDQITNLTTFRVYNFLISPPNLEVLKLNLYPLKIVFQHNDILELIGVPWDFQFAKWEYIGPFRSVGFFLLHFHTLV